METYTVRVTKDYLTFCCAHFITFDGNKCERLHGHNYGVCAEIVGELNDDYLVFDFITLKKILRKITDELDHRMIVPTKSEVLEITADEEQVRIQSSGRGSGAKEWIFPRRDCVLLPIGNSTAELLAHWLTGRLREELHDLSRDAEKAFLPPRVVRIEVEETPGQSAVYAWTAG